MPVTTRPSPSKVGKNQDYEIDPDSRIIFDLFTSQSNSPYERDPRRPQQLPMRGFGESPLIAYSIGPQSTTGTESTKKAITVYSNGFVAGVIRAFNQDLHLIIRPDDVWQAILSQFTLFVNGNAERLRHMFVTHEGKRELTIDLTPMTLSELDLGKVAQEVTSMIQDNVVDAELRQWMIPDFSTTTDHDKAVAAFTMMGAMQKYFKYEMWGGCGLPSVTLLGTRYDWEMLANRVNKLHKYGKECQHWASLLKPVMRYMLRTFDEPDSQEVKDFWLRVAYKAGKDDYQDGVETLSGWITAFAYFEGDGKVTKDYEEENIRPKDGELDRKRLTLDGVLYPLIKARSVTKSLVLLPIKIIDMEAGVQKFATAVSGSIGMSISESGTTAQPASAWWVVQEFEESLNIRAEQ
ncbi:hypothetical protein GGR54DRAFT_61711 [Hypoxylon sp. NC1633]|nr:hypothetical protein GGR54DRAFT_61711 [Hypoxylon sp. NC1633]